MGKSSIIMRARGLIECPFDCSRELGWVAVGLMSSYSYECDACGQSGEVMYFEDDSLLSWKCGCMTGGYCNRDLYYHFSAKIRCELMILDTIIQVQKDHPNETDSEAFTQLLNHRLAKMAKLKAFL